MRSWKHAVFATAIGVAALFPMGQALGSVPPSEEPIPIPLRTSPSFCTVPPADVDRLFEIAGDAIYDLDPPTAGELIPTTFATTVMTWESEATISLTQNFIACMNANDILRAASFISDDFIVESAGFLFNELTIESPSPEWLEPLPAEDQMRIAAATGVYQLSDGRYSYTVDLGPVTGEAPFVRLQFIVVEQDGVFLIDELRLEALEIEIPTCGTDYSGDCHPDDSPDCAASDYDGCRSADLATYVMGVGYSGWIMTAEQSTEAAIAFGLPANGIEVSEAEIAEAEAALPAHVARFASTPYDFVENLQTGYYDRQYFGYAVEFDRTLVINGYCTVPYEHDASQDVIVVSDGGDCFWQATYDLTDHEFVDFSINGGA